MSNSFFDLDLSYEDDPISDFSKLPAEKVLTIINLLPENLREVAYPIFYEKRTMSDVSQDLGIRHGELVSRLHRAQLSIGIYLMQSK